MACERAFAWNIPYFGKSLGKGKLNDVVEEGIHRQMVWSVSTVIRVRAGLKVRPAASEQWLRTLTGTYKWERDRLHWIKSSFAPWFSGYYNWRKDQADLAVTQEFDRGPFVIRGPIKSANLKSFFVIILLLLHNLAGGRQDLHSRMWFAACSTSLNVRALPYSNCGILATECRSDSKKKKKFPPLFHLCIFIYNYFHVTLIWE